MIFSREEYKYQIKLFSKRQITASHKSVQRGEYKLWLSPESAKLDVIMYTCHVFLKTVNSVNFRLMAGPDKNSVVVVKFNTTQHKKTFPYELIDNIFPEYIDTQVRLYNDDFQ